MHVGAQDVPELLVAALVDQVQVDLAQRGQEPVRVVEDDRLATVLGGDPVVGDVRDGEHADPDPLVLVAEVGFSPRSGRVVVQDHHPGRERLQDPDRDAALVGVRPQHGVRVSVLATDDLVELLDRNRLDGGCAGHDTPILATAASGIPTQVGRLRVSYTVS